MAFLHKGDHKPATVFSFYPCIRDSVYLEGLKEGEVIQSKDPYFFQNANGYLAIDDRFVSMQISKNKTVIQTIDLSWNKLCTSELEKQPIIIENQPRSNYVYSSMLVISVGILVIVFARRFFNAHK